MKIFKFFLSVILALLCAESLYGQSVSLLKLSELEAKLQRGGDVTFVVNFWATWCAPCVKELPHFQEIHDKYGASGVKVMLISLDSRNTLETKVKPFVSRTGITADFFLLDEANQQEYIDRVDASWSGALPATLIINQRKGKKTFREGEMSYSQLEEALEGFRE
ncbi:MAG: hypothetical protein ABS46_03835 [Cytophagaceae bacterium SCN 52-12]|nr:MAG: hypothetical protein ABS46_03835 [Cytophagaceae bacterium SCN 52-12]